MNKLFGFLVLLLVFLVGVGFYRGWFTVSSPNRNADGGKVNINLTVDSDKMKADAEIVKEKAAELTRQASDGGK